MKELNKSEIARLVGYPNADTMSNWADGYKLSKSQRKGKEPDPLIKNREQSMKIGATFIANGFTYYQAISIIEENEKLKKELSKIVEGYKK